MNTLPHYIYLDETPSTNSYLNSIVNNAYHGTVVYAKTQTSGRGQLGNKWESESGKNITFSIFLCPEGIEAKKQFLLSEIVSIAIVNVLCRYITSLPVTIKWPNDIYVGDKKICGILIENTLTGNKICHSIAGIGLNVNQRIFHSDAPNPISMYNITGKEYELPLLLDDICREILFLVAQYNVPETWESLHTLYCNMLWRKNGFYRYSTSDGDIFEAEIKDVAPDGTLSLIDNRGQRRTFAFKEVIAII